MAVKADTQWYEKAKVRHATAEIVHVPWWQEAWYIKSYCSTVLRDGAICKCSGFAEAFPTHFAEMAQNAGDAGKVSFFDSEKHGMVGRRTIISPGRYLQKFYPKMGAQEIDKWVGQCKAMVKRLQLATTRAEVKWVYAHTGVNSCMSRNASGYESAPIHPTEPYGTAELDNDIAIAYWLDGKTDTIGARAMVRRSTKKYGRIYGDAATFKVLLAANGYTSGMSGTTTGNAETRADDDAFEGAKLLFILAPRQVNSCIAPYMDLGLKLYVQEDGKYLYMSKHNLDNGCRVQHGQRGWSTLPPRCAQCKKFGGVRSQCDSRYVRGADGKAYRMLVVCTKCPKDAAVVVDKRLRFGVAHYPKCLCCGYYVEPEAVFGFARPMLSSSQNKRPLCTRCKVASFTDAEIRQHADGLIELANEMRVCWSCMQPWWQGGGGCACNLPTPHASQFMWTWDSDGLAHRWPASTWNTRRWNGKTGVWESSAEVMPIVRIVPTLHGYSRNVAVVLDTTRMPPAMLDALNYITFTVKPLNAGASLGATNVLLEEYAQHDSKGALCYDKSR